MGIPIEGNNIGKIDDIDIDGIVYTEQKKDEAGLLKVPEERKNVVLCQCHDSKVAYHWETA